MQSHHSSKTTKPQPPRLPWGMGSAALRGKVFWIVYRDAKNKVHYENSGTDNPAAALRLMAERALPRAKAMVATLERLVNENADPSNGEAGGGTAAGSGRDRGKTPTDTRAGKSTKKGGR